MKKSLLLVLFAILLSVFLAACTKPAVDTPDADPFANMEPINIKFAHAIAEGELINQIIEDWMAEVTERSDGKITFDYYPAGQLGTFVEIIEQVELGVVDMSCGEPSLYEPWCPEVSMLYAPMICSSYEHLGKSIYGKPGELIAAAMSEKNNTYILDWAYAGARVIASKRPLRTLDDMSGLIIRSPESQVYIDTFNLFGMSPQPMAMSEMYSALELGVVEACECPALALYEGGYGDVTGNICKTRHMYALTAFSANETFWDALPDAAQELMLEVWDELKVDFNTLVQTSEDEYYQKFEADGVLVTEFEDHDAFDRIAQPYWRSKADSIGGNAGEILDAINELR